MKYSIDKKEKYCLMKLEEEKLNTLNAPKLKSELVLLNAEGQRNLVLDLSNVKFVDSSGLSAILIGNRLCKNANGTFVLAVLQESVLKLIKISQLDTLLNMMPTVQEGIDFILMEELGRDLKGDEKE